MSKREDLRKVREGSVINFSSKKMETELVKALIESIAKLEEKFDIKIVHEKSIYLSTIVNHLIDAYPDVEFKNHFDTSYLTPDGGILYLVDKNDGRHVILISEAKRQGTNDIREAEGKEKQSKGNAIERLGKNVTGLRAWLSTENIFPFVVFGEGVDFAQDSSILDRVSTIAMFAPLNKIEVVNVGENHRFNRGSFYFRENSWSAPEMSEIMVQIAERSVYYYFSRYGQQLFNLS